MSHRGRWLVVGLLAGFFGSPLALAFASWNATAVGTPTAQALSITSGNSPSVTVAGRDASLTWTASQFSNGVPLTGYLVERYDADGVAPQGVTSGTCAGVVFTTSCTESAVPAGSWNYTMTPAAG